MKQKMDFNITFSVVLVQNFEFSACLVIIVERKKYDEAHRVAWLSQHEKVLLVGARFITSAFWRVGDPEERSFSPSFKGDCRAVSKFKKN